MRRARGNAIVSWDSACRRLRAGAREKSGGLILRFKKTNSPLTRAARRSCYYFPGSITGSRGAFGSLGCGIVAGIEGVVGAVAGRPFFGKLKVPSG